MNGLGQLCALGSRLSSPVSCVAPLSPASQEPVFLFRPELHVLHVLGPGIHCTCMLELLRVGEVKRDLGEGLEGSPETVTCGRGGRGRPGLRPHCWAL